MTEPFDLDAYQAAWEEEQQAIYNRAAEILAEDADYQACLRRGDSWRANEMKHRAQMRADQKLYGRDWSAGLEEIRLALEARDVLEAEGLV